VSSRRKAEELILSGKVKVNGNIVKELATEIGRGDIVLCDGVRLEYKQEHTYLMIHKPKGVICSNSDEKGRKTVLDLLPKKFDDKRLFAVGRLDYDTEGLLLLTDDGDMSNRLMHPRFEVPKTYVAKIEGTITLPEIKRLEDGIIIDGVKTKKCKINLLGVENKTQELYTAHPNAKAIDHISALDDNIKDKDLLSRLEVIIVEGRNRQVRKMFETFNRQVVFLKRTAIGEIKLGGLSRGTYRELNNTELNFLKKL